MNRKHFFKTLLAGIGVGVAAKQENSVKSSKPKELLFQPGGLLINRDCEEIISKTDRKYLPEDLKYRLMNHDPGRDLTIGRVLEVSETKNGIGFTYEPLPRRNA